MTMKYTLPIGAKLHSPKRTYTVEKVLGQGGFGITYKVSANLQVENVTIRTYFAIKEFFMSDACERNENDSICYSSPVKDKVEESRKDFLAEAQRLNKISLEHPNIIHVNEVFEANNTVYYVMEYLDAGSLRSYVREHGALSENEALAIMMPIMNAVDYLHQHRMTHLDIKPDNVMLKHDPDSGEIIPVLIDFGLSKHYDKNGNPTSTMRASGFSDGYAPVEQYTGIYTFSPQADVYALAATLYYALVGKDPVIATELSEEKIRQSLNSNSIQLQNAIVEAMRMHKSARSQSVMQLMNILLDNYSRKSEETKKQALGNKTKTILTNHKNKKSGFQKWVKGHLVWIGGVALSLIVLWSVVDIVINSNNAVIKVNDQGYVEIEAVDLGLSVKWANCNLGAKAITDAGFYYGWGEVKPRWRYFGSFMQEEIDDISGNGKYDAAHATLGGTWRMPTYNEVKELLQKCEFTDEGREWKVTGPNGKSIILPKGGWRYGKGITWNHKECHIWSSTSIGENIPKDTTPNVDNGYGKGINKYAFELYVERPYGEFCNGVILDGDKYLSLQGRDIGVNIRPVTN